MESPTSRPLEAGRWLAVFGWAALIFVMSSRPGSTLPGGYSVQAHFLEYFVFGVLLFRAFRPRHAPTAAVALALVVGSLYGITDEMHQHFVVMRTPDVSDWGIDTLGAVSGALAAYAWTSWHANRSRSAEHTSLQDRT